MREQRLVFGEDAALYDRARAGYPQALVDDVMAYAGVADRPGRALEVGAGTGKATVSFAPRLGEIVALEPSPEMAAVARSNCQGFRGVRIIETTLETWAIEPGAFDLVFSAQAWHWVDPAVRYDRAAEALKPGGTLALFWHRTAWSGEVLRDEFDDVYRRLVPELREVNPGFPGLDPPDHDGALLEEVEATGRFGGGTERVYPRPATFTADSFVDLLLTQSNHRLLAEDRRDELFATLREVIAWHGGTVTVPFDTLLVLARRAP